MMNDILFVIWPYIEYVIMAIRGSGMMVNGARGKNRKIYWTKAGIEEGIASQDGLDYIRGLKFHGSIRTRKPSIQRYKRGSLILWRTGPRETSVGNWGRVDRLL